MIRSQGKRIIIIGHFSRFIPTWRHIGSEDNNDMSWDEFCGNVRSETRETTLHAAYNSLHYVVDSSEYVVRFTSSTPGFRSILTEKARTATHYLGSKTDIVCIRSHGYLPEISRYGTKEFMGWGNWDKYSENFSSYPPYKYVGGLDCDPTSLLGIRCPGSRSSMNLEKSINDWGIPTIEGGNLIDKYASRSRTYFGWDFSNEIWLDLQGVLQPNMSACSESLWTTDNFSYPVFKSRDIRELKERLQTFTGFLEEKEGLNIKHLTIDQYIELIEKIANSHITYDELESMLSHKKWGKSFLERKYKHGRIDGPSNNQYVRSTHRTKNNLFNVLLGIQSLEIALSDVRFKEYDIYFYALFGLDDYFIDDSNYDRLSEYLLISKYLEEKKIKFLPDDMNQLTSDYSNVVKESGMNLLVDHD